MRRFHVDILYQRQLGLKSRHVPEGETALSASISPVRKKLVPNSNLPGRVRKKKKIILELRPTLTYLPFFRKQVHRCSCKLYKLRKSSSCSRPPLNFRLTQFLDRNFFSSLPLFGEIKVGVFFLTLY
jgi:hypothetical protein